MNKAKAIGMFLAAFIVYLVCFPVGGLINVFWFPWGGIVLLSCAVCVFTTAKEGYKLFRSKNE